MEKVSIIVPVYNGEKNLNACVASLLKQSHENIEILLMNDGSKDNSLVLCRQWEEKDPRIKVYTHENHGVSFTRNRGLELFTGDWVTFVDCDDTVEPDYVAVLLCGAAEHGVLASQCLSRWLVNGKEAADKNYQSKLLNCEEALMITGSYFLASVWCKLYHRSLVNENGPLRFDEDIRIGEDLLFWCRAVMKAQKVYAAAERLYNYIIHSQSAMGQMKFEASYTDFIARGRALCLFDGKEELKNVHIADRVRVAEETLLLFRKGDDKAKKRELMSYIRKNRKLLLQNSGFSRREKLRVLLINFSLFRIYLNQRQARKAKETAYEQ